MGGEVRQRKGASLEAKVDQIGEAVEKPGSKSWKGKLALFKVSDDDHYNLVVTYAFFLVIFCYFYETYVTTGYGRFGESAVIALDARLGWFLLELPATLSFVYFFFIVGGKQANQLVPKIMAGVMCWHYSYRGWLFPYLIRVHEGSRNFSLIPAFLGSFVTVTHGYLNARWFAEHGKHLTKSWLKDPRFLLGVVVYFSGFAMLVWHDKIVRDLRSPGGPRYKIPQGGFFEYATAAQYFCELWTFFGFFLLSWGPNGLFILTVSMANLIPRAVTSHNWYLEKFGDEYPKDRAYIFPFVY